MNFLERILNRIYQGHLRRKEESRKRKEARQKEQRRAEKIFKAISDYVHKDTTDMRKHRVGYDTDHYKFNLKKTKISIRTTNYAVFGEDIRAEIQVDSIDLALSKVHPKGRFLERWLAAEIDDSVKRAEQKDKERALEKLSEKIT